MAGSYNHCNDDQGQFTMEFIENMGDAQEALEMMHHMIGTLSGGHWATIAAAQQSYYATVNPTEWPQVKVDRARVGRGQTVKPEFLRRPVRAED